MQQNRKKKSRGLNSLGIAALMISLGPLLSPLTESRAEIPCSQQALQFLDETQPLTLSSQCLSEADRATLKNAHLTTINNQLGTEYKGYQNWIISSIPQKTSAVLAGKHTSLNQIRALSYDSIQNELLVLQSLDLRLTPPSEKELLDSHSVPQGAALLLIFSPDYSGNVPPLRRLYWDTPLSGVEAITLDSTQKEIYLLDPGSSKILIFNMEPTPLKSRTANVTLLKGNDPLRTLQGSASFSAQAQLADLFFDPKHRELFVLDSQNGVIDVFDRFGNTPKRTLSIPVNLTLIKPTHLRYLPLGDQIEVYCSDGSSLTLPRAASRNE